MTNEVVVAPSEPPPAPHPLVIAIDRYVHRARDVKFAARHLVPVASRTQEESLKKVNDDLATAETHMEDSDPVGRAHGVGLGSSVVRRAERLVHSNLPAIVESSLFLSLFTSFDVFTGDLLTALHLRKSALFDRINKSIPLSTILAAPSIEALKTEALNDEIETFRRKSYVEQFEQFESWFKLTLRDFPNWPYFIEAAQRRNLLTHCGGVVSDQYRSVCSAN